MVHPRKTGAIALEQYDAPATSSRFGKPIEQYPVRFADIHVKRDSVFDPYPERWSDTRDLNPRAAQKTFDGGGGDRDVLIEPHCMAIGDDFPDGFHGDFRKPECMPAVGFNCKPA